MDFFNSSFMKIFRLDANYSSLKPNLQYILQSHLIFPFPPPLVCHAWNHRAFCTEKSSGNTKHGDISNSSRDQPAVSTTDMMVSGLVKGKIIYFQQLQDRCLHGVIKGNFHCLLPRGLSTQSNQNDPLLLFSYGNAYNNGLDADSHEGS